MDVKTRSGNKDFDYLLKSSCGELLALEITQLPDLPAESTGKLARQIPDTKSGLFLFV